MNNLETLPTTASSPKLGLGAPLVLLMLLTACGGMDNATPTRDVSKQDLRAGAGTVQTLSDDEAEEVEEDDEDEDKDDVEAVVDGSFEAGVENPNWTATPELLCTVAVCGDGAGTAGPEDGEVWAWFGGTSNAVTQTLEQTVTLPRGDAELEFELWAGAVSASAFSFQVTLDGTEIFSYSSADIVQEVEESEEGEEENDTTLAGLAVEDENDKDYTEGYEDVEIDLSDYTDDKTHVLRFAFTKDGLGDTNLSLDEVSLEVESLEDATQDIVDMVVALPLKAGIERALVAKLNGATKAFERNKDKAGINKLGAFSNQVKALSRGKKPRIPTADASILIASAQELIAIAR